jgi:glycosyltransferase involved in cell wall biosynthesis
MRILFFSHYFPPEVNAPALRTYEHCARWVKAGHDVTVVTCVPNCPVGKAFDGYRSRLRRQVETVDGIRVVRVWTYLAANAGTVRRTINYLSFFVSGVFASLRLGRPDVVVATSPQFFCGWAGAWAARLKRVPFVLEIRDIWPESITAVEALRSRPLLRFLAFLEKRLYRAAAHLVTVGEGYQARILEKADVADRISVITNGVDLERFAAQPPDARFLGELGLTGKLVCSYVGTIGMAHGLDVVLDAAQMLKDQGRDDVRFCLVGDGAHRERLARRAAELGVERWVVFAGRQPAERVPLILASSDVCLIHLKECELFESVIPSKMFEAMAMGRPIILGVRGDARALVQRAGAGLDMEPGSAESLVSCLTRLAGDPSLRSALGASGRAFVEEHYNRDRLAQEMLGLLESVADAGRHTGTLPARAANPDNRSSRG